VSRVAVLAVDGGNSKTDLALVEADGSVLALVRGPLSSPQHLGVDGCLTVVGALLAEAVHEAGLDDHDGQIAQVATLLMAGVDFPAEEDALRSAVEQRGWAPDVHVDNDTFAVLRAGTERGWGVAVTCGAGINCVGVSPDGRHARFPALGAISGDWGGGYDLGLAAVSAAARSEDGRGPRTSLERAVPAHFALKTPSDLAEAIHDVSLRLPPIDDETAQEMLSDLRGVDVLRGARGRPVPDLAAVSRVLVAMGDLALDLGTRLVELDVNPLFALPDGALAGDALAVLQ